MKLLMKLLFICVIVGLVYPCSATVFLRFAKSVKVRHDPTQIVGKLKSTQVQDQFKKQLDSSKHLKVNTGKGKADIQFTFKLPKGVKAGHLTSLSLRTHFMSKAKSIQTWKWSIRNFEKKKWIKLGTNNKKDNIWTTLEYTVNSAPLKQFVKSGSVKVRLHSKGKKSAKIDYLRLLFDTTSCSAGDDDYIVVDRENGDATLTFDVNGTPVTAVISFPDCGRPTYPAVVLMHGSGGMWKDDNPDAGIMSSQNRDWRDIFNANCFIGCFVDSFEPRGESEFKSKVPPESIKIDPAYIRPRDAYGALQLLRKLRHPDCTPHVVADKVAIMGFSHGGSSTTATLFDENNAPLPDGFTWTVSHSGVTYDADDGVLEPAKPPPSKLGGGFVMGVSYYPGSFFRSYFGNPCNDPDVTDNYGVYLNYSPLFLHTAELDSLTSNTLCLVNTLSNNGGDFTHWHYSGNVDHGFDGEDTGEEGEASDLARKRTRKQLKLYLH